MQAAIGRGVDVFAIRCAKYVSAAAMVGAYHLGWPVVIRASAGQRVVCQRRLNGSMM